jgi:hypothetical protein
MKTKIIIPCLLLVALLVWWLLAHHTVSKSQQSELIGENTHVQTNNSPHQNASDVTAVTNEITAQPMLSPAERVEQIKKSLEEGKSEWRAPINFYGSVLDESNNPVVGANIHFIWTDLSPTGNSERATTSDGYGLFSLLNTTGKNLIVSVSKSGYYPYQPSGAAFNYAGENQNFVPDQGNPVVFRLRKKGEGANLVHLHKGFPIPKDGSPVLIDLATGNTTTASESAFKMECWTHDNEKKEGWKFDWKCRISVPGGGLQIYDGGFPFLALEDGYVSEEIIDMPVADNPQWAEDVQRKFYIKTADGHFARMEFRMIAHGDHFCQIDSFFNPDGSRNLEPK